MNEPERQLRFSLTHLLAVIAYFEGRGQPLNRGAGK